MSETRHTDDHRLLDWLYGELGDEERASFEAELERNAELRAEADELVQTRAIVREMKSVEPPAALSSFLLHAAAKEVAREPVRTSSGKKGLFGGLLAVFHGLAARPALAAAAALVVVVGVAGALYTTGRFKNAANDVAARSEALPEVAAPEAARQQPAPDPASGDVDRLDPTAAKDEAPAFEADGRDGEAQAGKWKAPKPAGTAGGLEKEGRVANLAEPDTRAKLRDQKQVVGKEKKKLSKPSNRRIVAKNQKRRPPSKRPATDAARSGKRMSKSLDVDFGGYPETNAVSSADKRMSGGRSYAPPPSALGVADSTKPARPYYAQRKALDDKWAKERESDLLRAKDCRRVAQIANDILDRNSSYYMRNVAASKPVKRCSWYVKSERTARVRRRTKKGAGDGGKANAAPRKRRAAPARQAEDAAYDEPASAE